MGKLDLKRFRHDLKETRASREPGSPGRPATTGAMAVVRENLDMFDRMRGDDPQLTWADIALSLGKQGVLQRDGQPITAKRLAALISTIRKQRAAKALVSTKRAERPDVAVLRPSVGERTSVSDRRLTLAPDLVATGARGAGRPQTTTEEDHRHAALDRAKAILKKD